MVIGYLPRPTLQPVGRSAIRLRGRPSTLRADGTPAVEKPPRWPPHHRRRQATRVTEAQRFRSEVGQPHSKGVAQEHYAIGGAGTVGAAPAPLVRSLRQCWAHRRGSWHTWTPSRPSTPSASSPDTRSRPRPTGWSTPCWGRSAPSRCVRCGRRSRSDAGGASPTCGCPCLGASIRGRGGPLDRPRPARRLEAVEAGRPSRPRHLDAPLRGARGEGPRRRGAGLAGRGVRACGVGRATGSRQFEREGRVSPCHSLTSVGVSGPRRGTGSPYRVPGVPAVSEGWKDGRPVSSRSPRTAAGASGTKAAHRDGSTPRPMALPQTCPERATWPAQEEGFG